MPSNIVFSPSVSRNGDIQSTAVYYEGIQIGTISKGGTYTGSTVDSNGYVVPPPQGGQGNSLDWVSLLEAALRAIEVAVSPRSARRKGIEGSTTSYGIRGALDILVGSAHAAPIRRDPLALDLDTNGITTTAAATNGLHFDHDANGFAESTGWLNPDDAFLAWDRNGSGTIDSGLELFGDQTTLRSGAKASSGLQALAEWDTNKDGQITAADSRYNDLRVWRDLNQDGISQTNELQTLPESGIASISLVGTATNAAADANGNTLTRMGSFTRLDPSTSSGQTGTLGEVVFKRDTTISLPVATLWRNISRRWRDGDADGACWAVNDAVFEAERVG